MAGPTRELALDDKLTRKLLATSRRPAASKSSITASVSRVQEGLDGLAKDLANHRQAKMLKIVPSKLVEIKGHACQPWRPETRTPSQPRFGAPGTPVNARHTIVNPKSCYCKSLLMAPKLQGPAPMRVFYLGSLLCAGLLGATTPKVQSISLTGAQNYHLSQELLQRIQGLIGTDLRV